MKRVGISLGLFSASACVVFLADLASKMAIVRWVPPGSCAKVLGDYVKISHVRNIGASFGLFPGYTYPLIVISSVAVVVVLVLAMRSRDRASAMFFLGLILGGALGNLYDRLRLGEVIDFIDIGFGAHRWPVFNVADVGVTLGVFLLLLEYVRRGGSVREQADDAEDPAGEADDARNSAGSSGDLGDRDERAQDTENHGTTRG